MTDDIKPDATVPPKASGIDPQFAETIVGDAPLPQETRKLGQRLAELEIVEEDEYRTISDSAGHDPGRILKCLADSGKLTDYQRDEIASGSIENIVLDDYVILDRIGAGGMGEVFKARNKQLNRIEAIKTIHTGADKGSTAALRFQREAQVLAKLEHPSIVPVYKVGTHHDVPYIAMKFVDGEDLRVKTERAVRDKEPIPIFQACRWIRQAASALGHAHKAKIVHRDIKPGNLMVTPDGHLYVLDMGIARLIDPSESKGGNLTRQNIAVGTPEFMPPEQWADATTVSPETDIYALGCTLFFVLAGRPPFVASKMMDLMAAHTGEAPPLLSTFRHDAPAALDDVLRKALAKQPEERFRSAEEFIAALDPFCEPSTTVPPPSEVATQAVDVPPAPARRSWIWFPVAAAVLAGGIAIGAVIIQSLNTPRPALVTQKTPNPSPPKPSPPSIETIPTPAPVDPTPQKPAPPAPPAWLADFRGSHPQAWENDDVLIAWIKSTTGSESLPDTLSPALREAIDKESRLRAEANAARALDLVVDQYRAANPNVWPDRAELIEAMTKASGGGTIKPDLDAFRAKLDPESKRLARPFEGLRLAKVDKNWEKDWVRSAAAFLQEIAQLQAAPPDPNWKFEAVFLNPDRDVVREARVKEPVSLAYRSSRPAYVTVVQWDDQGLTAIVLRDEKSAQKEFVGLGDSSFDFPGEKKVTLYATARPFFTERVDRIDGNTVQLKDVFSSPRVFARIKAAFDTGKPVPAVPSPDEPCTWSRSVAVISIRN